MNYFSMTKRLESLDVLRGLDMICLVVLEPFAHKMGRVEGPFWREWIFVLFNHESWEGFSMWDLVMPLFMFISGVTIPFSYDKYRNNNGSIARFYLRLFRRFVLLWLLGMVCQGNLLSFNINQISLFSNTLQAIAIGYVISAILFLQTRWKTQIIIALVLLLAYWGAMEFCSLGAYGGGNYSEHGNLAYGIDAFLLGCFRNTTQMVDGRIIIDPTYTHTWILSSLNFVVIVLCGMLVGHVLKSDMPQKKKIVIITASGFLLVVSGQVLGNYHPIISHIWTSSMVLLSSGICFLLTGLFYYLIEYRKYNRHLTLLKIYGVNSILAYVMSMVVDFSSISNSFLYGIEKQLGVHYSMAITSGNMLILFFVLYFLYRNNIFIRV